MRWDFCTDFVYHVLRDRTCLRELELVACSKTLWRSAARSMNPHVIITSSRSPSAATRTIVGSVGKKVPAIMRLLGSR